MTQVAHRPAPAPRAARKDAPAPSRTPSFFFNGFAPRRRALVLLVGALFGFALTVVWSAQFVDKTIGDNVADTLLGHAAKGTPIAGTFAGVAFALASGIAGTFTACNIAVFSALAPLAGTAASRRGRVAAALRPLGFLAAGAVAVSALYGVVVALVGTGMPQFQTSAGTGFAPRLVQAMVVYGLIGLIMTYLGLAAAGVVRDPLARMSARFPNAPMVVMGALIGGFLIGRPFALFRQLFQDAARSHNVLYGAAVFSLQTLGNILIVGVLFLLVTGILGERLHRWLVAKPSRASAVMAAAFIAAGVFMILYWDVRMLARRDLIWYPLAPWAA
ncbi:hypothetical protein AMK16_30855 [Streptomyces sp. CB00455]|uniref:hypothetical protein n=1 Tax=Streptomyces sp. CB00455 TaxID=1703927 RepID=UPI00093E853F|nr:hypothetical protein [Streptomyces sp. CB00455]OKK14251.1 hypothetical protein AMK16_30855 [Streptomyces sp. CB00455]